MVDQPIQFAWWWACGQSYWKQYHARPSHYKIIIIIINRNSLWEGWRLPFELEMFWVKANKGTWQASPKLNGSSNTLSLFILLFFISFSHWWMLILSQQNHEIYNARILRKHHHTSTEWVDIIKQKYTGYTSYSLSTTWTPPWKPLSKTPLPRPPASTCALTTILFEPAIGKYQPQR